MPRNIIEWLRTDIILAGVTVDVVLGGHTADPLLQNTFVPVPRHPKFAFSLYCDVQCRLILNGCFQAAAPLDPFVAVTFAAATIVTTPQLPAPYNLQHFIVVPYPLLNVQLNIPGIVNSAVLRFYALAFD